MVLALLAAVADGDMFERADAVHALLRWRSGQRGGVPQSSIALYVAGLKVTCPSVCWTKSLLCTLEGAAW